jgi:hypothetical protein
MVGFILSDNPSDIAQLSALATAAGVLPSSRYPVAEQVASAADQVVHFVKSNLYDAESGQLFRSWRDGKGPVRVA